MCARWRRSFENFLADMGERPEGTTLERRLNSGNYTRRNCAWVTMPEQARNRRNTKRITFRGETMCVKDWAVRLNLPYDTLQKRLAKYSVKQVLTNPKPSQKQPNFSGASA